MDGLSKNALCPAMHRSKNALHPMEEISDQDVFFQVLYFSVQKFSMNLTVDSEPSVSRVPENGKNDLIQKNEMS